MPATKIDDNELMDRLTEVFRTVGYEGATLSKLSEATGLQRASLYHRFPGGKREMADAVLVRVGGTFHELVLSPLSGPGTPEERLQKMARQLDRFYSKGSSSCLLDTLSVGDGLDLFEEHIRTSYSVWIDALAGLTTEATKCTKAEARRRAEDCVLRIQGSLVLSRGTGSTKPFQRTLRALPECLLEKTR